MTKKMSVLGLRRRNGPITFDTSVWQETLHLQTCQQYHIQHCFNSKFCRASYRSRDIDEKVDFHGKVVSSVEKGGIICGKSLPDQVQQQKPIGTMVSIVMKVSKQAVRQ